MSLHRLAHLEPRVADVDDLVVLLTLEQDVSRSFVLLDMAIEHVGSRHRRRVAGGVQDTKVDKVLLVKLAQYFIVAVQLIGFIVCARISVSRQSITFMLREFFIVYLLPKCDCVFFANWQ